jgi:hypothetical protein
VVGKNDAAANAPALRKRRVRALIAAAVLLTAGVTAAVASQSSDARRTALPEISIADSGVVQYQTGNSTMTFKVTLSAASTDSVTVDYATRPGDSKNLPPAQAAEIGEDYLSAAGTLTFAPGETTKNIDVTVVPEPGVLSEPDEYFGVDLTNPVNAIITRGTATGTIVFTRNPRPGDVNVLPVGSDRGQCVKTVNTSGCVPLNDVDQFKITDVQFVDPGKGIVAIESTAGKARFYGTPFALRERKTGGKKRRPVLALQLIGGNFSICAKGTKAADARSTQIAAKKKPPVRRLFGNGKGRFRTKGRYSAGTVRGTSWVTVDRCDGTLTRVFRGVVSVHDLVLNTYVKVRAGHSYLASPAKKKKIISS